MGRQVKKKNGKKTKSTGKNGGTAVKKSLESWVDNKLRFERIEGLNNTVTVGTVTSSQNKDKGYDYSKNFHV